MQESEKKEGLIKVRLRDAMQSAKPFDVDEQAKRDLTPTSSWGLRHEHRCVVVRAIAVMPSRLTKVGKPQ